jgi:hypothetical protein
VNVPSKSLTRQYGAWAGISFQYRRWRWWRGPLPILFNKGRSPVRAPAHIAGNSEEDGFMSDEACAADSAERQRLRARHGVRLVKTEEEGQDIALLPNGVAGFTAAPGAGEMPVFAAPIYLATEVHKSAEGTIYLIGYLTAAEAAVLEAGAEPLQVNLYPEPYEEAQTLVAVPL